MTPVDTFIAALDDRRFVGQWNAARYLKSLKFNVERRYAEAIIKKAEREAQIKNRPSPFGSCPPEALQLALLDQAAAGLSLSPALNHAYLIPYTPVIQFTPGYRGLIHLAIRGGTIRDVQANRVHAQDPVFKIWTDEHGRHLQHEESRAPDRGKVTHSYCLARFVNGGHHIEVMDREQLDAVEAAAKMRKGGGMVWDSAFRSEMEKKAPIRRGAKFWPVDPDGHLAHMLATADKFDPLDFDRAETSPGGDLLVSEEQQLQLHAALTDLGIEDKRAGEWLLKKAQALGYPAIEHLPSARFDEVLGQLKERAKVYLAAKPKEGAPS
jgi:phage RecT family recombinase